VLVGIVQFRAVIDIGIRLGDCIGEIGEQVGRVVELCNILGRVDLPPALRWTVDKHSTAKSAGRR
jgi:hypothetical protein